VSESDPAGRIGEQHQAYRKGFVLGLTMAEVSLLVVFVLLLLMSLGFARRDAAIRALQIRSPLSSAELLQLQEKAALVDELARAMGRPPAKPIDDDFRHLVRNAAPLLRASRNSSATAALEAERERLEQVRATLTQAMSDAVRGDSPKLASTIADQAEQTANLQGQVKALQSQLLDSGMGRVLPSCWTTPDGQIDFLLDVDLTSAGIRARERQVSSRAAERARLEMPIMHADRVQSVGEFLRNTQAVFDLSIQRNCRFYVMVYDSTRSFEKPQYKRFLQAVEGHFYKRESRNASPF
jgi:hypothetical protein